jgi:hypothetical protein
MRKRAVSPPLPPDVPVRRWRRRSWHKGRPPELHAKEILAWADAHHRRTGKWPNKESGPIRGSLYETWSKINRALYSGLRGLPGGSSLARFLREHRHARSRATALRTSEILAWADAFRHRTGKWPSMWSGAIPASRGETWVKIDAALKYGLRELPGGSSLARFLADKRQARNLTNLPRLSVPQILVWADAHKERTGVWPKETSGRIREAPEESWYAIDRALRAGVRGLAKGQSLARLLAEHRGVRNTQALAPLTIKQILAWADAHFRRTGRWPRGTMRDPIADAPGETWSGVNSALQNGWRGLSSGTTLRTLLMKYRNVRNPSRLPALSVSQVLCWADRHYKRTGKWPTVDSGPIPHTVGETWATVDYAGWIGSRGLPRGFTLARLLTEHRNVRNIGWLPNLTERKILRWADAYHRRTGAWPTRRSGPILEAPGETWSCVNDALRIGRRGLPGGSSLLRLYAKHRADR